MSILDAKSLAVSAPYLRVNSVSNFGSPQPLISILNAHELPPTALRFNRSSSLLMSGSADNSVRVMSVPADLSSSVDGSGALMTVGWVLLLLLSILIALVAFMLLQQR